MNEPLNQRAGNYLLNSTEKGIIGFSGMWDGDKFLNTATDLEFIIHTYNSFLNRIAFTYIKEIDASKDIVAEIFIRLWRKQVSIPQAALKSFLFKCTHNACLNYIQKQTARQNVYSRLLETTVTITYIQNNPNTIRTRISKIIEQFPKKCKRVCELSFIEGLTNREIAQQINVARTTVVNHINIGRRIIKRELAVQDAYLNITGKTHRLQISKLIDKLPGRCKKVCRLLYIQRITIQEVARRLNKGIFAVYSLKSRGRKLIKQKLGLPKSMTNRQIDTFLMQNPLS